MHHTAREAGRADRNGYVSRIVVGNCRQGKRRRHPMQSIGCVFCAGKPRSNELMESVPKTRLIRQYIRSLMLGLGDSHPHGVDESLLIRDGVYCGHCFRRGGFHLVWFVEENQIKLFGPDGSLLRAESVDEIPAGITQQAA